jgi:AcrR family transcriptional regulator
MEEPTMGTRPRDAERTKIAILAAARRLFAKRGIHTVSIRDIAAEAGVSHGLVQQYFGTRDKMVAAIIQHEIDAVMSASQPNTNEAIDMDLVNIRRTLREGRDNFSDFARIIMRAELDGIEPEKMIDPSVPTPAMHLASVIEAMKAKSPLNAPDGLDPKIVSVYINAALFGFAALAPWLMTSIGMEPDDHEKVADEFYEITNQLISLAGGDIKR